MHSLDRSAVCFVEAIIISRSCCIYHVVIGDCPCCGLPLKPVLGQQPLMHHLRQSCLHSSGFRVQVLVSWSINCPRWLEVGIADCIGVLHLLFMLRVAWSFWLNKTSAKLGLGCTFNYSYLIACQHNELSVERWVF